MLNDNGFDNMDVPLDDFMDEENPWNMGYEDELEERAKNGEFDELNDKPNEDENDNSQEKDVPPFPDDEEFEEE